MAAVKELSPVHQISILRDYFVHDLRNVRNLVSFVREYPSVLTNPRVAESIVPDPMCYHTAVVMEYWKPLLSAYPYPDSLPRVWQQEGHIPALANESVTPPSLDEFLDLVEKYTDKGLYEHRFGFPDHYYLVREAMRLATRMSRDAAPIMCGVTDLILPMNELKEFIPLWGEVGMARYAWCRQHSAFPWVSNQSGLKQEVMAHDTTIRQWPLNASSIRMLETAASLHNDNPFEGSLTLARTMMAAESTPLAYPDGLSI